jgi:Mn-dependent DtxR family transcriptional regulator
MAFKRLTQPQRDALHALKMLGGEMMVTPQDARSLKILQRRGLVRYRYEDGVRLVVLRETTAQARVRKRDERQIRTTLDFWTSIRVTPKVVKRRA